MSKQEFIDGLRAALNGRIDSRLVIENINYYEDYINTQIGMGRTEEEVLEELGDPRLIARTIIDASDQNDFYQNAGYQSGGYRDTGYRSSGSDAYSQETRGFRVPGWLWMILVILTITLIMSAFFSVLSFLAPIIFPVIVVIFLVKLFRDWLN